MSFLIHWLSSALQWAFNLLGVLPKHIWVLTLEGIAKVVDAIPVPSYFGQAAQYVAALPPWVAFFAAGFQIPAGLAIILSAFVARFLLRRVPLIGG